MSDYIMNDDRLGDAEGIIELLRVRAAHCDACAFGYMQEADDQKEAEYQLRADLLNEIASELSHALRPAPTAPPRAASKDERCVLITEMTGTLTATIVAPGDFDRTVERYEATHQSLLGPHTKWDTCYVDVPPAAPRRDGGVPRLDIRYVFIEMIDDMPVNASIHATEAEAAQREAEFREEHADEFARNEVFIGLHEILIPPAR